MKKKIFLILISIILGIGVYGIFKNTKQPDTVRAVGDLTINWGVPSGNPIFSVSNFMPGNTETRTVIITNDSDSNRELGLRIDNVTDPFLLSSQIILSVKENGNIIFNTYQTLSDLKDQTVPPNFLPFAILPPSTSATYEFIATFNPDAGDQYQDSSVIFDIIIGLAFDLPQECKHITFNGSVIFGTSKTENLNGTPRNDIILAYEGDDKVEGGNGDDCIIGGPGNDRLNGNNGADVIFGNEGDDKLYGNNQNDYLNGEDGIDRAEGNNGTDTCIAETKLHCEP